MSKTASPIVFHSPRPLDVTVSNGGLLNEARGGDKVNASFAPVQINFESGQSVQMVLILCKAPIKAGEEVLISYGEEYQQTCNRP